MLVILKLCVLVFFLILVYLCKGKVLNWKDKIYLEVGVDV